MSPTVRSLFPVLAAFGPIFMAIGLGGSPHLVSEGVVLYRPPLWSTIFGFAGALTTGVAMLLLFRQQISIEQRFHERRSES